MKPFKAQLFTPWRLPGAVSVWTLPAAVVSALVAVPILALAVIAAGGSGDMWAHVTRYVLPIAIRDTGILLAGVGLMVVSLGSVLAWLVTAYEFPLRRILEWALLLPLAMPSYVIAYVYLDLLHPTGAVQDTLRFVLGVSDPRLVLLPDIRSMGGCIVLLGFILYPYVYLPVRAVFLMQSGSLLEAASTLGAGQSRIFFRVALPLARPSIAAGSALALMEALNDIGASEFLGVRTLSVAIFSTWINRSSLPGAAQIGLALLAIVVGLVLIERWARRNQQYATSARSSRSSSRLRLSAGRGLLVAGLAFLPIFVGFLAPVSYLAIEAGRRIATFGVTEEIVSGARNSMTVAFLVMVATIAAGLLMAFVVRIRRGPVAETCLRISMLGYAMPGTVLAVGLVSSLGALDNAMAFVLERFFGLAPGLLLTGSGAAIVYACAVRFLAIPAGGLDAALTKTPISLDHAARSLGATNMRILRRIHLPLLRPAILSAGLLVFVDCMKELPATLLLRPLNFETLATHLYAEASRGVYEDGSVAALAIVLFALLPVALLAGLTRSPVSSRADSRMSGMAVIRP